jgi:phenylacetate-CoA oxygenase PaaJ subunit
VATVADVWDALATVTDPEYPLSIVDLGMVYDVSVSDEVANIQVTFTSIGCPAIDMILGDVQEAVSAVPGIDEVQMDIVWSPPWTKERITDRGRRILRFNGVVN